ncbi:MAPEG family protein [Roseibium sp.]|uniref:MAPEG family protein n=1 Tax=Roseibium sp. TaxID=1936156 RepID=UPI003A976D6D
MTEPFVLVGIAVIVFASAAIQHAGTVLSRGVGFAMTDRSEALPETGFSGRSRRTLQNNLESATMAVPILTVLVSLNLASGLTGIFSLIYLAARVSFTINYWIGFSRLRSFSWGIGMACLVALAVLTLQGLASLA